jgi:hypothetical protein
VTTLSARFDTQTFHFPVAVELKKVNDTTKGDACVLKEDMLSSIFSIQEVLDKEVIKECDVSERNGA